MRNPSPPDVTELIPHTNSPPSSRLYPSEEPSARAGVCGKRPAPRVDRRPMPRGSSACAAHDQNRARRQHQFGVDESGLPVKSPSGSATNPLQFCGRFADLLVGARHRGSSGGCGGTPFEPASSSESALPSVLEYRDPVERGFACGQVHSVALGERGVLQHSSSCACFSRRVDDVACGRRAR